MVAVAGLFGTLPGGDPAPPMVTTTTIPAVIAQGSGSGDDVVPLNTSNTPGRLT